MNYGYYRRGLYLEHHGIKGQRWGIRRFQNPDGTLTEEGKRRYGRESEQKKLAGIAKGYEKGRYSYTDMLGKLGKTPQVQHAAEMIKSTAKRSNEALVDRNKALKSIETYLDENNDVYEKVLDKACERYSQRIGESAKDIKDWFHDGGLDPYSDLQIDKVFIDNNPDHPLTKSYKSADYRWNKAAQETYDAAERYASQFLGAYGDVAYDRRGLDKNKYLVREGINKAVRMKLSAVR